ncbi:MAG: hypothetical protein P8J68_06555 [Arenicellaceae bacterium]|nr:hypothetical protein [Arenicellaceae bacterium]
MHRNGWGTGTLNIGDQATFSSSANKNPKRPFLLLNYLQKDDGEKLYAFSNRDTRPVEKIIVPSIDFFGTWRRGTIYPYRTNFSHDSDSIRIQKERIEESRVIWLGPDAEGLRN